MSTARITLDNPSFSGRFRDFGRGSHFIKPRPKPNQPQQILDVHERFSRQVSNAQPAAPRLTKSTVVARQAAALPKRPHSRKKPLLSTNKLMTAMAVTLFIMGSGVAILGMRTNNQVVAEVQNVTKKQAAASAVLPSEQPPSSQAIASYSVDPSLPRYIRAPKIGLFARVTKQGLDAQGAVKAPNNIHDAGWYDGSSKPGDQGAMLLDSHVSGPTTRGAFYNIKKLSVGDIVEVERGDGQKFSYRVVRSDITDADSTDMGAAMQPAERGKQGLNMITCTGKFNAATKKFEQRIVVYAVQV